MKKYYSTKMSLDHSHDDRLIKKCEICQKNIKEINEAGKRLNELGVWDIPKDWKKRLKKGEILTIWKSK